ncbi:unnamed protein product [Ectocarpus sp. CCAP 1310/34]|nr:unnamed protein product [Ectocarpus sp. CCAP 1310/34]
MREEFSTLVPLCTHALALSTRSGAEAREKLTLQEKLAYSGIRTPDLTSRRFRSYQLDHKGDRQFKYRKIISYRFAIELAIKRGGSRWRRAELGWLTIRRENFYFLSDQEP